MQLLSPTTKLSRAALLAMLLGGLPLTDASAQLSRNDLGRLQSGDSVRFRLPGALRVHGSMMELRGDTLMMRVEGLRSVWPVSGADLLTLELYGRRSAREGFRHGAVLGMVSGLFAGAVVGVAINLASDHGGDAPVADFMSSTLSWSGLGVVFGGLGGGFIGGARPGSGWVTLELPASPQGPPR